MDFMTIKQASEKWGICTRRVQTLCTEGRIDGAERLGHQWSFLLMLKSRRMPESKAADILKQNPENGENEDGKKTV